MRLVTRSDFDGLACGALLKEAGIIDHWKFAHPKDLQDGLIEVTEDDCLANVPFVEGCGSLNLSSLVPSCNSRQFQSISWLPFCYGTSFLLADELSYQFKYQ